ncbi:MAG: hypothetical protein HW421_1890 [Ignavibacteria bacterium]|nr:hypothetical protein [Ignavibacteria bacterium]
MKKLLLLLFISTTVNLWAQSYSDSIYHFELTETSCPVFSLYRVARYPGAPDNVTYGYGFFLRGMWHPGRLLSVGFMSGYIFFANDKLNEDHGTSASLSAIPLQVVVSMQANSWEIGIGMGSFLLMSTINSGTTAYGTRSELALTFFTTYFFNISKDIYIGPELRASYLSFRGIYSLMPSFNIRYNILYY